MKREDWPAPKRKLNDDLQQAAIDTWGEATQQAEDYKLLVENGHRTRNAAEERKIASMFTCAEITEQEYYRRGGK